MYPHVCFTATFDVNEHPTGGRGAVKSSQTAALVVCVRSRQIPLPVSRAHSFVASGQPMAASRGSSATACLHQNCDGIGYDMGASGLRSFSIENLAVKKRQTPHTAPQIAVLRFQLGGLHHQPPAGDHTHLGYCARECEHVLQ